MRQWVSALGRRAAFALARFAREPRDEDARRGRLLPVERKSGDVVLIWALERDLDTPELKRALDQLDPIATRILVTTSLDVRGAGQTGCMVETIPDAAQRVRMSSQGWAVYLTRRFARIRESWDPDFEVTVGTPVEQFLAQLSDPEASSSRATQISTDPVEDSETSAARAG